jgi:hypothetical protein
MVQTGVPDDGSARRLGLADGRQYRVSVQSKAERGSRAAQVRCGALWAGSWGQSWAARRRVRKSRSDWIIKPNPKMEGSFLVICRGLRSPPPTVAAAMSHKGQPLSTVSTHYLAPPQAWRVPPERVSAASKRPFAPSPGAPSRFQCGGLAIAPEDQNARYQGLCRATVVGSTGCGQEPPGPSWAVNS